MAKKRKKRGKNGQGAGSIVPPKRQSLAFVCRLIYLVIVVGIILRIAVFTLNPVLSDAEAPIAADILNRDFWGLFNPLSIHQVMPPLFLSLVKCCSLFSQLPLGDCINTTYWLRFVPLSAGILSLFLFYYLLQNIFASKFVQLTGMIIFVLNPVLIKYTSILNPVSTDVLTTIILLIYFVKYNPDSYTKQFYQVLILSVFALFSYPAIFILAGGLGIIISRDFKKFLCAFTAFAVVMIFYFVYHIWGVMEIHGAALDSSMSGYFITASNITDLCMGAAGKIFNIFILPLIAAGVAAVGFLLACFRDSKIAIFSAVTLLAVFTLSYLHLYGFTPETLVFFIPVMVIFVCEFFDLFPADSLVIKILPVIMLVLCSYYLLIFYGIIPQLLNV